jgi:hypothetical protein
MMKVDEFRRHLEGGFSIILPTAFPTEASSYSVNMFRIDINRLDWILILATSALNLWTMSRVSELNGNIVNKSLYKHTKGVEEQNRNEETFSIKKKRKTQKNKLNSFMPVKLYST